MPENLLRFYVWFSAPMSRDAGLPHVTLIDDRTGVVTDAFLPVDGGFWNHDFTRYTLFFDPGRVKAGILPNERMGRPLVAGHRYRLAIATTWRDAQGAPLVEPFEHRFAAGPAATAPLDLDTWQITLPVAGTRQPIMLRSPAPLDHAIALRAIGINAPGGEPVDGEVSLDVTDTRWQLVPSEPWRAGSYSVVALEHAGGSGGQPHRPRLRDADRRSPPAGRTAADAAVPHHADVLTRGVAGSGAGPCLVQVASAGAGNGAPNGNANGVGPCARRWARRSRASATSGTWPAGTHHIAIAASCMYENQSRRCL